MLKRMICKFNLVILSLMQGVSFWYT